MLLRTRAILKTYQYASKVTYRSRSLATSVDANCLNYDGIHLTMLVMFFLAHARACSCSNWRWTRRLRSGGWICAVGCEDASVDAESEHHWRTLMQSFGWRCRERNTCSRSRCFGRVDGSHIWYVESENSGCTNVLIASPVDKAGIQFQILNRSKGPAVWVSTWLWPSLLISKSFTGPARTDRSEAVQKAYAE